MKTKTTNKPKNAEQKRKPTRKQDTAAWQNEFLKHLRATFNVAGSAEFCGITRGEAYAHRENDAAFARAWDETMESVLDDLESEALRRARDGAAKPVFHGGKQVGEVPQFSDALVALILKSRRKEVYGEVSKVEFTGVIKMTDAEIESAGSGVEDGLLLTLQAGALNRGRGEEEAQEGTGVA